MKIPDNLRRWLLERIDWLRDYLELPREMLDRDKARANRELAEVLVGRLNSMVARQPGRHALAWLIETRIQVWRELLDYPTIQVMDDPERGPVVGFLEMLNGLVGTIGGDGAHADWGLISAVRDGDNGRMLIGFELTEEEESIPADEYPYEVVRPDEETAS